ncbi:MULTISPECIES: SDR family NAD(P)-dependent oxidoreductase [Leifsonia]|jgi:NAD(P)-dependent dehydrogenase (short-subunit alcohol dehydrogenase family)|uniref:NAD(P)-dependent dehydrogenase (Short-subunit alcohol dehydrogenase family) n=1 Tax=Leifsonia naganoensis TaxID=150025 RepID=A0A853DKZ3_9MICO|nr:SDR family NAD(P)-dependent oxidoreductase [Leifsonia naganoensis]NYK08253.1 NAD(P)-dependent dehydrogenase (short-subunit alcohol dehydrogenase family) [Leifsonia naganoensis]
MSTTTPGRFAGKTAIVTGAGSGIGKATALRLASEGARVIGSDISAERLAALVDENPGLEIATVAGDVSSEETIAKLLEAAGGRVDALANVAGIMDGFLPPAEVDDATWDRVFTVNVTAIMRLSRAVLPLMVEAGSGSIVNVSSEAGLRGSAAGAAYTASKHAVIGLTKSTSVFYAPKGVRANAVAPGGVATNVEGTMRSAWAGERLGPLLQTVVPPVAQAEQLAASITWLLSDDSANVTGAVLASDGGWSAI